MYSARAVAYEGDDGGGAAGVLSKEVVVDRVRRAALPGFSSSAVCSSGGGLFAPGLSHSQGIVNDAWVSDNRPRDRYLVTHGRHDDPYIASKNSSSRLYLDMAAKLL